MPKPLTNEAYRNELSQLADWIIGNVQQVANRPTAMDALIYAVGFGIACNATSRERAIEVLDFAIKAGQDARQRLLLLQACGIGEMTEH